ncbi:hypothetical protein ACHAXS_001033 [Conticribra weissflogii]
MNILKSYDNTKNAQTVVKLLRGHIEKSLMQNGHGNAFNLTTWDLMHCWGEDFFMIFPLSCLCFCKMMEYIMQQNIRFYNTTKHHYGSKAVSLKAHLIFPLKTVAFGVPCHVFCDYFWMIPPMAQDCCEYFNLVVAKCYHKEYLRVSTSRHLTTVLKLNKTVHHVDGMLESLACMHTVWKKCPKTWKRWETNFGS